MERYNDPLFIDWHRNIQGESESVKMGPEEQKVAKNKIFLHQIPDKQYRVKIPGMEEVNGAVQKKNQFVVDYTNGLVTFHESLDETTIKDIEYYGRGVIMYPASRIYTHIDDITGTIHTLGEIDLDLNETVETIQELNQALKEALEASEELIELKEISEELYKGLLEENKKASILTKDLKELIIKIDPLLEKLKVATEEAIAQEETLSIENTKAAENIKLLQDLYSKLKKTEEEVKLLIESAKEISLLLETNMKDAEDINNSLLKSKEEVQPLAESFSEMIKEGRELRDELQSIVEGTDFEAVIKRLDVLEKNDHNHSNLELLENFSEKEGEIYFKGNIVGRGDMKSSIYDPENSGKVLKAISAENIEGLTKDEIALKSEIPSSLDELENTSGFLKAGLTWGELIKR